MYFRRLAVLILLLCSCFPGLAQELEVRLRDGSPVLSLKPPNGAITSKLLRSTSDLAFYRDPILYPVAEIEVEENESVVNDTGAPQGVEVFYQLESEMPNGKVALSRVVCAWVPEPVVDRIASPRLAVDKLAYTLSVLDGGGGGPSLPRRTRSEPNQSKAPLRPSQYA